MERTNRQYMDIGHSHFFEAKKPCQESVFAIFFFNGQFNIENFEIHSEEDRHDKIFGDRISNKEVAAGRYENCTGDEPTVSLILHKNHISDIPYFTKKIEELVDKTFNNPKILRFD